MRQSIEFQKSRALVQALMSQQGANDEHIKKVFDDMKEAFFPFDRNQRNSEIKKMRDAMNYWVGQGPVVVQAEADPRQEKLRASKLARGQRDLENRIAQDKSGRIVGLDPYDRAKHRSRGSK